MNTKNPMNLEITPQQLRRAADIKERIEALQAELAALVGSPALITKGRMSAAVTSGSGNGRHKPKRRMSAAQKARLAAIARARWRKAKAAGKNAL